MVESFLFYVSLWISDRVSRVGVRSYKLAVELSVGAGLLGSELWMEGGHGGHGLGALGVGFHLQIMPNMYYDAIKPNQLTRSVSIMVNFRINWTLCTGEVRNLAYRGRRECLFIFLVYHKTRRR